jgi:hypothetical protein
VARSITSSFTRTQGPSLRGDLEYVQMTLSFRYWRAGRWVEMLLRYELARQK